MQVSQYNHKLIRIEAGKAFFVRALVVSAIALAALTAFLPAVRIQLSAAARHANSRSVLTAQPAADAAVADLSYAVQ